MRNVTCGIILCLFMFRRSDDGEREDSDNDNPSSPKKNEKEFKDKLDTLDKIRRFEMHQKMYGNTSPSRSSRPIKKVDMGAAATYGKDQTIVSAFTVHLFIV